jgi:undecaprenyl-diphosphatase
VQGAAEALPVSSSAQLTLLPWLLGWDPAPGRTTFAAGLHAGSCAGVAWALRDELGPLLTTPTGRRTAALLAAATVPAALAGALLADPVEQRLGRPPQLAALLAAAGAALWLADRRPQRTATVGPREAALAAGAQVLALAPGVSRSGAVLTALRAAGVEREAATRFSLLLSLPITVGAAVLTLGRADRELLLALRRPLTTGIPAAALAAAGVTRLARRGTTTPGAVAYRLGLAAVVARRLRSSAA